MNGLLVVDKLGGMTSRDVVDRAQRWFPRKTKLGHTGTLDPLATGVLVVCVGTATRLADFVQAMGKGYHARVRLGATSNTDDADGEVTAGPTVTPPTREQVAAILANFVGTIEQTPPAYSAVKLDGRRAYDRAREGVTVAIAARPVRVDAIRVTHYEWPLLDLDIECGKGTYIRSIARDLGAKLGCGGLIETLRRTRVGPFTAEQGVSPDVLPEEARTKLLPMAAALDGMPRTTFDPDRVKRFADGQRLDAAATLPGVAVGQRVAIFDRAETLVGIATPHEDGTVRSVVVFRS